MSIRHNQIKWQCRRGLRELDLLFRKVIIEQLDSFENHELDLLEQVLKYEDQALFDFIFNMLPTTFPNSFAFLISEDFFS